jgi:hypothetical protein
MAKQRTIEDQLPFEVEEELDRVDRRVARLRKLVALHAPSVIISEEARMIAYGVLVVMSRVDDWEESRAEERNSISQKREQESTK